MTLTPRERAGGVVESFRQGPLEHGVPRWWVRVGGVPGASPGGAPWSVPSEAFDLAIVERDGSAPHGVLVQLGDKPAVPTGGGSGWEERVMPKRGAVLVWKGRGLMKLAVPVLLDGTQGGAQIAGSPLDTLLHFFRLDDAQSVAVQPPVLKLLAKGDALLPRAWQGLSWVLDDIQWGEGVADDTASRIQQAWTLIFTEYREPQRLQTADQAKKKPTTHGHTTTYTVRNDAETLSHIAEVEKLKGGWRELAAMQKPPLKDTRLHKGQTLVVPGR